MAYGEILKKAREARGLTYSQVAEITHLKVQIIQDLEKEDFRKIAAPIYGRSFVKLYAEFLELDPVPLVRDFMEIYTGARVPPVSRRPVETAPVTPPTPITRTVSDAVNPVPIAKPIVRPIPIEKPGPEAVASAPHVAPPAEASVAVPSPATSAPAKVAENVTIVVKPVEPALVPEQPAPVVAAPVRKPAPVPAEQPLIPAPVVPVPVEIKPLEENVVEDLKAEREPNLFNRHAVNRAPVALETEASIPEMPRESRAKVFFAHLGERCKAVRAKWAEAAERRRLHRATRQAEHAAEKAEREAARAEKLAEQAEKQPLLMEKRHERVQALTNGLKQLTQNLGRTFPEMLPRRTWMIAAIGGGILLVFILVGIGVLFSVNKSGHGLVGGPTVPLVSSVPDLYAD